MIEGLLTNAAVLALVMAALWLVAARTGSYTDYNPALGDVTVAAYGSWAYAGFSPSYRNLATAASQITGTVKEKGQPDQPLVRRVQLVSENTRVLVAETWSDTTGAYRFELLDLSQRYTVVSYDYKQMYRAVIADNLRPEMMP